MLKVKDIRNIFADKFINNEFVIDKSGVKMLEIIGESFLADESTIFGTLNNYVNRELEWYNSCSLNVNDIPGGPPEIWKQVATKDGRINSNYGYLIYHPDNGLQYQAVKTELLSNPWSRRAVMIYTRPTMHMDYNEDGMSDFICTNTVQYFIRDGKLNAVVQMRSNDAIFGLKNDLAWQKHILDKLSNDLEIESGNIIWHVGSLHIYSRHFPLVSKYIETVC